MVKLDCSFTQGNQWFRYRAAAIIIEQGHVMVAKNERDPYYYSVGGGVTLGESAADAVRREVLEESGLVYEVDRLAFIHENFFSSIIPGIALCHEVAFYFLMRPHGGPLPDISTSSITGDHLAESMHWLPIDRLQDYFLYPSFYAEKLLQMPAEIEHIVTHE